jgi:hypothetical protein
LSAFSYFFYCAGSIIGVKLGAIFSTGTIDNSWSYLIIILFGIGVAISAVFFSKTIDHEEKE